MKIYEMLKKYRTRTKAKCSKCGKQTTWFFKEDKPLCKECKYEENKKNNSLHREVSK